MIMSSKLKTPSITVWQDREIRFDVNLRYIICSIVDFLISVFLIKQDEFYDNNDDELSYMNI